MCMNSVMSVVPMNREGDRPGVAPPAIRRRVLVLCGDRWHPAEIVRQGLAGLADGEFEFAFSEDETPWVHELKNGCPLLVVAKANHRNATDHRAWLTPENQLEIRRFVQRGGGLLVIHGGIAGYDDLLMMRETTGGVFLRHPAPGPVAVRPAAAHPVTRGVNAFTVPDEHYFVVMDDLRADVFLHSHSAHGRQPAGWTRTDGRGRVCVLTPGHNVEMWQHPEFQRLLRNGLDWVARANPKGE
jgi:type 1 glutamine amidotransferase